MTDMDKKTAPVQAPADQSAEAKTAPAPANAPESEKTPASTPAKN